MENQNTVQSPPVLPPPEPPTPQSKPSFKPNWKLISTVVILVLGVILILGNALLFLGNKQSQKTEKDTKETFTKNSPTPSPTPVIETKTYINPRYAFQVTYPSHGTIVTDQGTKYGECGNAIKDVSDQYVKEGVMVDNFVEVVVVDWSNPINDYLKSQQAQNFYDLTPIATSSSGADEAFFLKLKDNWQSYTSSLVPPLPYTLSIYKKYNKLFLLNLLQTKDNLGGCIPSGADFSRNFWSNMDNFKFVQISQTVSIADWKTYTMPIEKLIIRYPQTWTMTTKTFPENPTAETVTFTSPNNFQLTIGTAGTYSRTCTADCQSHNLPNSVLATLNFYQKPLYVVVHGLKDDSQYGSARTLFSVIPDKTCFDNQCGGYVGQRGNTVAIQGGFIKKIDLTNTAFSYTPVNDFVNSQDVKTALLILNNLKY